MQKRFCSCGQAVLVDYRFSGEACQILFKAEIDGGLDASLGLGPLHRCPHCGCSLNINELF